MQSLPFRTDAVNGKTLYDCLKNRQKQPRQRKSRDGERETSATAAQSSAPADIPQAESFG